MKKAKLILSLVLGTIFIFGIIIFVSSFNWNDGAVVSYFKLDAISGAIIDSNGIQNGTATNGVTRGFTGKIENATFFDGTNDFIEFGDVETYYNFSTIDFSITGWFNTSSAGDVYIIAKQGAGDTKGFSVSVNNGALVARISDEINDIIAQDGTAGIYNDGDWHFFSVVFDRSGNVFRYIDGSSFGTDTGISSVGSISVGKNFTIGKRDHTTPNYYSGTLDEIGIWNRTLTGAEILELYNSGSGLTFQGTAASATYNITLISPLNISTITTTEENFTSNFTISGDNTYNYTWKNATFSFWFSNGTLFNSTSISLLSENQTNYTLLIGNLILGNYFWNTYAYYGNATFSNFTSSLNGNFSFFVGASLSNTTYLNETYETASETFVFNVRLLEGSQLSTVQLVYNGTNHTISNISNVEDDYTFTKTIDLPANQIALTNQTNNFFLRFTYEGSATQELTTLYQNVSFINLQTCDATYNTKSLNFTILKESDNSKINASENAVDFSTSFNYWLGSGSTFKNYSFSTLNNNTNSDFQFCIFPIDYGITTNMNLLYDSVDFSEREYFLNEANLTNELSNISLYLLNDSSAVKFTITVKRGTSFLPDAYITVSKFFVGEGVYKTISIRKTDDSGKFVEYLELDRDYRFYIILDGDLLGAIDKKSECSSAPCELTLQVEGDQGNIWSAYNSTYASNILSNLTYNHLTKIVTYEFVDSTGLAQYFRMEVYKGLYNESSEIICNSYSYSTAGTMTCNLTSYNGDFMVKTYISRSPEKIDKILTIAISEIKESLNGIEIFICFFIILGLVLAGAAISGGNPTVILVMFGLAVLITKIATFLPFSWGIVAVIELIIIWLISEVRT